MTPTRTARGDLGERVLGEDADALAVFGDRADGNLSLEVGERGRLGRRALLARLGLDPGDAVFMEQVHGGGVARVDRGGECIRGVDALVTIARDVALAVLSADCVPVLLVDPGRGVAAAHAGRLGVQADIAGAVVRELTTATSSPASRVRALLGPAIGGCCYELPSRLVDDVCRTVPAARARTSWGTESVDLPAAVEAQLRAAGVHVIRRAGGCTRCHSNRWFSHRAVADGAVPGRNGSAICRRTP